MKLRKMSLQIRLTLLVLATVLLFGLLAGYESYKNALQEADEMFDAQLAQFAQSLMVVAAHTDDEQTEAMPALAHKYQQSLAFQVWDIHKDPARMVLRSDNLATMARTQMPVEGYSNSTQGDAWRYYRQRDTQRGLDVVVGQNGQARNDLAQQVAWHNIAPFLFGLPVLALVAVLAIRFGLHPLRRLAASLHQFSPQQLDPEQTQALALHEAPKEIAPVIEALNSLLGRIAVSMENERRFTADAAHELRTPLAALQSQLQAAQLTHDATERNASLGKALQGAKRMAYLIDQLLTLSRLDELNAPELAAKVGLAALTQSCCADVGADAVAKNIALSFTAQNQPVIKGSAEMLRILLRNLLDNALRYTPQAGRVEVIVRMNGTRQAEIVIADSGSGVTAEQLPLLGQRFRRFNAQAAEGVGLGLSIAHRIAELHRANINFGQAKYGGLEVRVEFPVGTVWSVDLSCSGLLEKQEAGQNKSEDRN